MCSPVDTKHCMLLVTMMCYIYTLLLYNMKLILFLIAVINGDHIMHFYALHSVMVNSWLRWYDTNIINILLIVYYANKVTMTIKWLICTYRCCCLFSKKNISDTHNKQNAYINYPGYHNSYWDEPKCFFSNYIVVKIVSVEYCFFFSMGYVSNHTTFKL